MVKSSYRMCALVAIAGLSCLALFVEFEMLVHMSISGLQSLTSKTQNESSSTTPFVNATEGVVVNNSNTRTHYHSIPETPLSIFYNAFINPSKPAPSISVIQKQLQRIGGSYAAKVPNVTLYYNLFGYDMGETNISALCNQSGLRCKRLQYRPEGQEKDTLQDLYDYCSAAKLNSTRVIYMHSKGSFHFDTRQDTWSHNLGMAVTSQLCVEPLDQTCNVCGQKFFPLWAPIFMGNFFNAKCSYVKRLIPPMDFHEKLRNAYLQLTQKDGFRLFLYPRSKSLVSRLGINFTVSKDANFTPTESRIAMEHWVANHPSAVPCDVFRSDKHYSEEKYQLADLKFGLAPRHSGISYWYKVNPSTIFLMKRRPGMRDKDYFLLLGLLARWKYLYNEYPPPSSWVWKFFPDGEKLKGNVYSQKKSKGKVHKQKKFKRKVHNQ